MEIKKVNKAVLLSKNIRTNTGIKAKGKEEKNKIPYGAVRPEINTESKTIMKIKLTCLACPKIVLRKKAKYNIKIPKSKAAIINLPAKLR